MCARSWGSGLPAIAWGLFDELKVHRKVDVLGSRGERESAFSGQPKSSFHQRHRIPRGNAPWGLKWVQLHESEADGDSIRQARIASAILRSGDERPGMPDGRRFACAERNALAGMRTGSSGASSVRCAAWLVLGLVWLPLA